MFSLSWLFPRVQLNFLGSVIGAIGGIAGGLIGADSQNSANAANSAQSASQMSFQAQQNQKAMDFSERMAGSSYQRGVADMKAAGLNPMLGYTQGGASAPSGVTSAGSQARMEPVFTPKSFGTAVQAAQAGQQVEQSRAQVEQLKASSENTRADTAKKLVEIETERERPWQVRSSANASNAQARKLEETISYIVDKLKADTHLSRSSAGQIDSQRVLMKELQGTGWTKSWAPYLLDAMRSGR